MRTICEYLEGTVNVEMASMEQNRLFFSGVSHVRLDHNDTGNSLKWFVMSDVETMFNEASNQLAIEWYI